MLILYTATFCPNCPKVKKYLDSKGVKYEERDAEKLSMECAYYGIYSLPTVRFGDRVLAVGNDMRKLERFLRKNGLLD